jgi:hypothetical protein
MVVHRERLFLKPTARALPRRTFTRRPGGAAYKTGFPEFGGTLELHWAFSHF